MGLPEGARVDIGLGYQGHISYMGAADGTPGNDVVIRDVTRGRPGVILQIR
jgi:hypothetical protein